MASDTTASVDYLTSVAPLFTWVAVAGGDFVGARTGWLVYVLKPASWTVFTREGAHWSFAIYRIPPNLAAWHRMHHEPDIVTQVPGGFEEAVALAYQAWQMLCAEEGTSE